MKKRNLIRIITAILAMSLSIAVFAGCSANMKDGDIGINGEMIKPEGEIDMEVAKPDLPNSEDYNEIIENEFKKAKDNPLSTFSADVDTASYSNFRRMINSGYNLSDIPKNAIRTEEFLNYFKYDYALPKENEPFGVSVKIADCPWNSEHKLAIFGLRTEAIDYSDNAKPSNFVFLIDVSGSMRSENKLPLLKESFSALVENLKDTDTVSIVTYSGKEEVVLQGCKGSDKKKILKAINSLKAQGSTNGEAGLKIAYSLGKDYFVEGGNNRIIMASDGDLNVGISSQEELKKFIETKRNDGIYLSVLGFGSGNYKDSNMETLADCGNGNYFYIDSIEEGKKVLSEDLNATINTVADDVKFQVDFNANFVNSYRLIGYENRVLNDQDFNDDTKDAGEVGSGHCLTVAYELILEKQAETDKDEYFTLCVRYKNPGEKESNLLEYPVTNNAFTDTPDDDYNFAASVIEFCLILRDSKYKGEANMDNICEKLAKLDIASDKYKAEFRTIVEKLKGEKIQSTTSRYA